MEYEKIKQVIKDMENSNLTQLDIEFSDGTKLSMKKEQNKIEQNTNMMQNISNSQITPPVTKQIVEGNIITSPMVGTFYRKSSPTSEPYVELGKQIQKGDTVCIIEAMKLMNEIESEFTGKVVEILVEDGKTVEYGTPLFKIG